MNNLNDYVSIYKTQLQKGEIQIAYTSLVKFVMKLQTNCSKRLVHSYAFGNILQGYMDYTYFYFSNDFLKSRKLKFGLVLNHAEARFELWLLGQTSDVQKKYWNLLKTSKWNRERTNMPKYSILEAVLVGTPDFNDLEALSQAIESRLVQVSDEIIEELNALPKQ